MKGLNKQSNLKKTKDLKIPAVFLPYFSMLQLIGIFLHNTYPNAIFQKSTALTI